MRCRKYPTCVIFLKIQGSKDIKHDILDCQTHKYTNTNVQIHIQIHKNTNAAYDKEPEIPFMCYIFEKPAVQGHQKLYS